MKPRYVGPFEVLQKVGRNACKLQMPAAMKVHPVFNVALLRKYHGTRVVPAALEVDDQQRYEIERIVAHRGGYRHREFLIRWKGYDESEDMYLPEAELQEGAADVLREYKRDQKLK